LLNSSGEVVSELRQALAVTEIELRGQLGGQKVPEPVFLAAVEIIFPVRDL